MKRSFDFLISIFLIIILSPLLIITSVLIKMTTNGSLFFKQQRVGKNGKLFFVYKFRTMTDKLHDLSKQTFNNDEEITTIGRVIRRLKIDELPQLLNVAKGDMSLVGPRPCLPNLIKSFNDSGKKRLLVRPGLTGLAQVNGNIYLSWEERWEFDRKYVEQQSFCLDLKILSKTALIVFLGEKWGKKS
ncbi:sugar transferase [uncultured Psychrobacter sp.]|uniref:sugar transferase n=1 Tax=uncultured Psychrobacter sp. TaxID=259303 RepID=UPI002595177D|nr:sugar transferase [uncultured Psychrobacter sp.]